MVELYQDTLVDLLLPKNAKRLKLEIKKDSKGMVSIENVTIVQVSNIEELMIVIQRGSERRHVSGTQMNDESSRSHLILSIIIESTNLQTQTLARGKLSFVDLAGSERVKKSGSSANQLKEAQSINKSLSALGDVISALCSDGQHIPYRNHKLTMLMSDSLGGNAKTLMFVNASPAESNLDETYNSLIYASRVRSIVNDPSKNVSTKEIARLKKLVAHWKEQAGKSGDDEELEEIQEERPVRERKEIQEEKPSRERKEVQEEKPSHERKEAQEEKTIIGRKELQDEKPSRESKELQDEKPSRQRKEVQEEKLARERKEAHEEKPLRERKETQEEKPSKGKKEAQEEKPSRGRKEVQEERQSKERKRIPEERLSRERKEAQDERPPRDRKEAQEERPPRDRKEAQEERPPRDKKEEERPPRDKKDAQEERHLKERNDRRSSRQSV